MIRWLRSARGRRATRARWIAVAVLLVGAAVLALAPIHDYARRPSGRATITGATRGAVQRPSPVSAAQIARARQAARRFLAGYLPFAYGRGSAASVRAVTPSLRRQLRHDRVLIAPVERRRRPHVVSLTVLAKAPRVVVVTALIDDGGIANYAVRLTLRRTSAGWLVSRVDGG